MRKDVRMGFAVGGVLLAVIIVAVLVIHRNHNSAKTVAFDPGKGAVAPFNEATTDVAPRVPDTAVDTSKTQAPAAPAGPVADSSQTITPAAVAASPSDKNGTRWDALFASTAEDPIKAQLTTGSTPPKAHKSPRHEAPVEAVANAQIAVGAQPLAERPSPGAQAPQIDALPQSQRTHKVAQGETFVSIARAAYGDGRYYKALETANPTLTPEKLRPGVMVQLPPASQVKASRKSVRSATAAASTSSHADSTHGGTYTVQKDDSLYRISKKLYGKSQKADELYELNKQVIGPDSTKLKIGMVLKLPTPATEKAAH